MKNTSLFRILIVEWKNWKEKILKIIMKNNIINDVILKREREKDREGNPDRIFRSSDAPLASQLHRKITFKDGRFSFGFLEDIVARSMMHLRHNLFLCETPPCPVVPLAITYPRIKTPLACYLSGIVPVACHPCVRACMRTHRFN